MLLDFLVLVFRREEVPGWLEPGSHDSAVPSRGTDLDSVAAVEIKKSLSMLTKSVTKQSERSEKVLSLETKVGMGIGKRLSV